MATKSQASSISLKTLGGAFEQPKMNYGRDFLRENKLSLRDLQKTTIQRLTQQKMEHENRKYKHIQRFQKAHEQSTAHRSSSRSSNVEHNSIRQSRLSALNGGGTGAAITGKQNYIPNRRAYSQQRRKVEKVTCCCKHQQQENPKNIDVQYREGIPRSGSLVSALSKAESIDKEIQTEDINDEDFLYEALKKCSSSDVHQLQKQKSIDQIITRDNCFHHADSNNNLQSELICNNSWDKGSYFHQQGYEDHKTQRDQMSQHTPRFQTTHMVNGHNLAQGEQIVDCVDQEFDQKFCNLKIANDLRRDPEPQSSARSRQTMCSTSTKRSVHKLGSREDVRLPRYLEKEKREKEEERVRELNKDLNCPIDHYALSDEERLKALNKTQQKVASLINELNHMPMTMETLRIRKRKNEIERELTQLELDIRLYSKQKVYIPIAKADY